MPFGVIVVGLFVIVVVMLLLKFLLLLNLVLSFSCTVLLPSL